MSAGNRNIFLMSYQRVKAALICVNIIEIMIGMVVCVSNLSQYPFYFLINMDDVANPLVLLKYSVMLSQQEYCRVTLSFKTNFKMENHLWTPADLIKLCQTHRNEMHRTDIHISITLQ